jgi:cyclic-di-AMP phosphodiesterase PgpH
MASSRRSSDRGGVRGALRRFGHVLNEPGSARGDAFLHHGVRLALLVLLAFAVKSLFPVSPVPGFPVLEKGMVTDEDIIAQVAFPIFKSDTDLAREREEAAASVAPVLDFLPAAADTMLSRIGRFMAAADSAARNGERAPATRLRELLHDQGVAVDDETLEALAAPRQRQRLAASLQRAVRQELPIGFIASSELEEAASAQYRVRAAGLERLLSRDSIRTAPRFYERAAAYLPSDASGELAELQRLLLIRFFEPSLRLNREATDAARERARQAVPVVKAEVLRGEKIVGAHEQVRDAELERLHAYQEQLARLGELDPGEFRGGRAVGSFLFAFFVLLVFGLLLFFYRPVVYAGMRHIALIASLILALVGAAAVISRSGAPIELIPVAFPALVVAALWDGRLALNMALVMAVLLGGQAPFLGVSVLFTMVMGGAAASLSVRVVRRRAQTWVFISIIAAAYAAAALTLGLLRSWEPMEILWSIGWGALNAIGSALIAMGFLPLFESFNRITTDQTLLELTDMNRPLLKRLSLEAPGTYAHSINVANLAEAAARAIDANPLLVRVGAYYHDVGKLGKPQYFIENQPPGRNPHDKLKPATSAAIVKAHVPDGLRLAAEAKLPDSVLTFIREHHGTQPISFFYEKARELSVDGAQPNPADFEYGGPRPQSRETAILMLADSIESASRVLQDPTPERIRGLVTRIVDDKIAQSQLDDTPLTFRELTQIQDQFTTVLSGMYHQRIDYPAFRDPEPVQLPEPVEESRA